MDVPAFRERLLRLAPKDPLVLAVSGGGDSVALALLVKEAGRQAVVAHLDHGLRRRLGRHGADRAGEPVADLRLVRRPVGRLRFRPSSQLPQNSSPPSRAASARAFTRP